METAKLVRQPLPSFDPTHAPVRAATPVPRSPAHVPTAAPSVPASLPRIPILALATEGDQVETAVADDRAERRAFAGIGRVRTATKRTAPGASGVAGPGANGPPPIQRKNATSLPDAPGAGDPAAAPAVRRAASPAARCQVAGAGIIQRASINPGVFFGATRADNDVDADINADEMRGFGTTVNGVTWHTHLVFDPLVVPGAQAGHAMAGEGSGVTGVIGPDHPFGSMPASPTANANNLTAQTIRGGTPHVAAHIVNDKLGGPGIAQNLFAFPGTANTRMEQHVERSMKAAVAAGSYIHYRAVVNHPAQGPADSITMSWNKLDDAGNDIGGGQTGAVVRADATSGNTAMGAQGGGTEAKSLTILDPASAHAISARPWGPFQMPDPKNIVALGAYLDLTEFPAVGNKKAFEAFLANNKSHALLLQLMLASLSNASWTRELGRWIGDSGRSHITIKTTRGITQRMVNDLKSGTTSKKEAAFIDIMDTGDAPKVIPFAAGLLARAARANARTRV